MNDEFGIQADSQSRVQGSHGPIMSQLRIGFELYVVGRAEQRFCLLVEGIWVRVNLVDGIWLMCSVS